jgi:hypothetical protein
MQPIKIYTQPEIEVTIGNDQTVVEVNQAGTPIELTVGGTFVLWGDIVGNITDQTDLQNALNGKVDENSPITGATKTKITYDSKGLVTAGADATVSDISGLQTALDLKVPYTGATGNVTLGEYGLTTGYVQFDTTPTTYTPAVGNMGWNDSEGTIDLLLRGGIVSLPLGQKQVARVVNGTGGNVLKSNYQVVKVTGAQGQRLQVNLAQANNDANSADTLGLIAENINNNNAGFIITLGLVENINTTGNLQSETWVDGNVLYLSPTTPGAITNVKPQAPQHTVIVGFVVYAHPNNGKIFVKVDNGYELDELHNVRINTGTLANGQVLKYNTSLSVWENGAASGTGTVTQVNATGGTGISVSGSPITTSGTLTITNTAPDQTVVLNSGGTTTVTGTYPNFTISSADQFNGTVTSVSALTLGTSGTDLSSTVANGTTTPTITLNVPTASAVNRGVLSSADWTTFNSKQNALTNPVTGTGVSGQVSYWNGTTTQTGSSTFTFSPTAQLLVNNSVTAAGAIARGINFTPSLTASANNDVLVGLDINPTFTNGAFTGVSNFGIRSQVSSGTGKWNIYADGTANNYLAGRLVLGSTAFGSANLSIRNNITGGTNWSQISSSGSIQSDVTSTGNSFQAGPSVADSVTISNVNNYTAEGVSLGVGSVVTNYSGFRANNNTTATNNYGFFGNITSGTGRWNLYMNGTALNYLNGSLLVGTTTDAGYKLDVNGTARIQGNLTTNLTAGSVPFIGTSGLLSQNNASLFWDNTNGRLGIGTNAPTVRTHIVYSDNIFLNGLYVQNTNTGTNAYTGIGLQDSAGSVLAGFQYVPNNFSNVLLRNTVLFASTAKSKLAFVANSGAIDNVAQDIYFATLGTKTNLYLYGSTGNLVLQNGGTFTDAGFRLDVNGTARIQNDLTISDTRNIILATGTGTKIGTATTQKLAFFNATPIVQPSAVTTTQGIADALTSLGLLASSTISGGGGGSVTSVSVVSTNGFAGTVANASTTPAITLTTTITGLLKGNGTAISSATANTDYLTPYTLSTKTSNFTETATGGEIVLLGDTTTVGFTITLPTAVSNTAKITIKKIAGSNNLTIDGNGSQTIDGGLTADLVRIYESVTLVSDNSNWHII